MNNIHASAMKCVLLIAIAFARPLLAADPVNLFAAENGGELVTAPSAEWSKSIDGKAETYHSAASPSEAVYGFKDEQAATFDNFGVLIPSADNGNLKEFELLVGDTADGEFKSVGKFQVKNLVVMKTQGWQEFKFGPVTAKYLKFKPMSSFNGAGASAYLYEIRLMGELKK